jgi:rhodanese-related sulfurtransferase
MLRNLTASHMAINEWMKDTSKRTFLPACAGGYRSMIAASILEAVL